MVCDLVEAGHEVRAFVRAAHPSRLEGLPSPVEIRRGDLRDREDIERAADGVDAVVHAGARVTTRGPWEEFERTNVGSTRTFVELAEAGRIGLLVHVSSLGVVALRAGGDVVTEENPLEDPAADRGGYTRSKLLADRLAVEAARRGVPVSVVRPGILYGPGRPPPLGRWSLGVRGTRVVFGTRRYLLPLSFVDNVARGIRLVLECPGARGKIYHLVDPQVPLVDYLELRREVSGERFRVRFLRPGFVVPFVRVAEFPFRVLSRRPPVSAHALERASRSAVYDCRRAVRELGWSPETSLREGLRLSFRPVEVGASSP